MTLESAAAYYIAGALPSEQIPEVACDALAAGLDSPNLRLLAGETNAPMRDVGPLFEAALTELGIPLPLPADAIRRVALDSARAVVVGETRPYDAARLIWTLFWTNGSPEELSVFVGLASEFEDAHEFAASIDDVVRIRKEIDADIVDQARLLLAKWG